MSFFDSFFNAPRPREASAPVDTSGSESEEVEVVRPRTSREHRFYNPENISKRFPTTAFLIQS